MNHPVPTELYLPERPGSAEAIEYMCTRATTRIPPDAAAVAVAAQNVSRATDLLWGTGVGVVGALTPDEPQAIVSLARQCVATGATEIALPGMVLDDPAVLGRLRSFLGSSTPITVDITSPAGDVDLAHAELALVLGADFVSFTPHPTATNPVDHTSNLVALAGAIKRGGVKVASDSDHHLTVLRSHPWASAPGNARRCLPVSPLDG